MLSWDSPYARAPPMASRAARVLCMYVGFWASGQLESFTVTVLVRLQTCSS